MNVLLATQLFSRQLRVAMSMYKDECYELHDCEPTIALMEKVDNVITAMNSRTPENALRPDTNCSMRKAIIDFDQYLRDWEKKAKEEITKQKAEKKKKKKANKADDFDNFEENFEFPITTSTLTGFKVTLGTTLELLEFLHDKCNYDYLMTSRLNQDALEKFFGIMRSACGCNDHPDPILFGQVFRLLCSYSLATPPRGSNVTGGELLKSLMHTEESLTASSQNKKIWLDKIDSIVEAGMANENPKFLNNNDNNERLPFEHWVDETSDESDDNDNNETADVSDFNKRNVNSSQSKNNCDDNNDDNLSDGERSNCCDADTNNNSNSACYVTPNNNNDNDDNSSTNASDNYNDKSPETPLANNTFDNKDWSNISNDDNVQLDHDYDITHTSDHVVSYIAGFMARKVSRFTKCLDCKEMLTASLPTERDKLIEKMSDGNLIYPSEALFLLIRQLEIQVLIVVGTKNFRSNTMFQILEKISQLENLPILGCEKHRKEFMIKIINNFIVMRGHFLTDFFNRNVNNRQIMTKRMRKFAKK
ncbi:putative mediator of RNA polymerase II transcription subunit 24 isoform X1 [Cotesia glomerata]|uniref:putative mediator of RNA polymerase II transcription subunit 24 isoform X1 n=1 Tax=Cotesia glomerata TaxID=32391 RepID=UPI001D01ACDC|nr:putative mediator of RNA polymerase II transcription subunit 24 isoform X1 [Cotesia glomerata]